jgi:hypothetical protein
MNRWKKLQAFEFVWFAVQYAKRLYDGGYLAVKVTATAKDGPEQWTVYSLEYEPFGIVEEAMTRTE